jgi:uncharacterized protein YggE
MESFIQQNKITLIKVIVVIAVLLGFFLIAATCVQVKSYQYVGSGLAATDTITVQGQGTVEKAPDTAKFSFTIQDEEQNTASAQGVVSKKVTQVKNDLIAAGIPTAQISTDSYNSYPDYQTSGSVCTAAGCNSGTQSLKGYIVSQDVTVSVKDLTKTETVAGILGKDGVTSIDGPNLGFDEPNEVQDEARDAAIADAKVQAQKLASSLGVRLVRIVSFSDNAGSPVVPVMYDAKAMTATAAPAAPSIPTGVQTVNDTVSITYEIE